MQQTAHTAGGILSLSHLSLQHSTYTLPGPTAFPGSSFAANGKLTEVLLNMHPATDKLYGTLESVDSLRSCSQIDSLFEQLLHQLSLRPMPCSV